MIPDKDSVSHAVSPTPWMVAEHMGECARAMKVQRGSEPLTGQWTIAWAKSCRNKCVYPAENAGKGLGFGHIWDVLNETLASGIEDN